MTTITEFVKTHGITVTILNDKGTQVDRDGWEHHAYKLRITFDGRDLDTAWRQGLGIYESPVDTADAVLDSLISDAGTAQECWSFESFCDEFGYDNDSRSAEKTWKKVRKMGPLVVEFLGGQEAFEELASNVERL